MIPLSFVPSILIVCTANICRSPVVEALLKDHLYKQGLNEWKVASAGTWPEPGRRASRYSTQLMADRGLDISQHTSQEVNADMLAGADLVLCMESGHAEALRAEFPRQASKIFLLAEMADQNHDVRDPFGGPREAYVRMVDQVSRYLEEGLPRLIALAQENATKRRAG